MVTEDYEDLVCAALRGRVHELVKVLLQFVVTNSNTEYGTICILTAYL
jgi:hypothetical protein